MQKVSCPSCGAEVVFRSAASVMSVCEYCRSTLLKDAESVKDIGKVSEVLEYYSPIQINTSGSFQGRAFAVVGRIQLRYEAGFWNEWHILFDDGSSAWLSDASGQYVITLPQLSLDGGGLHSRRSNPDSATCSTAPRSSRPISVPPAVLHGNANCRSRSGAAG